jgi:hypothetical protein
MNELDTCGHFPLYSDCCSCNDCVFARGGEIPDEYDQGTCPYFEDIEE